MGMKVGALRYGRGVAIVIAPLNRLVETLLGLVNVAQAVMGHGQRHQVGGQAWPARVRVQGFFETLDRFLIATGAVLGQTERVQMVSELGCSL